MPVAGCARDNVHVELAILGSIAGAQASEVNEERPVVNVKLVEMLPYLAVIVPIPEEVLVLARNLALLDPEGMVTVVGTVIAPLEESDTTTAVAGDCALRVTVQVLLPPEGTLDGLQERPVRMMLLVGVSVSVVEVEEPFSTADSCTEVVAVTDEAVIGKFAAVAPDGTVMEIGTLRAV